ncbi:MAG: YceD family protein, partial [Desulfobacterales bacterium]
LPGLQGLMDDEGCEFRSPIDVTLRIVPQERLFIAGGRFSTAVEFTCVRCLEQFSGRLEGDFEVAFGPEDESTPAAAGEEIELDPAEMGMIPLEGEDIDFRPVVEEQMFMAFPMQPLCRPDCKGICPRCGADLNREACRCEGPEVDPRLAALKNLKNKLPK